MDLNLTYYKHKLDVYDVTFGQIREETARVYKTFIIHIIGEAITDRFMLHICSIHGTFKENPIFTFSFNLIQHLITSR